MRTHYDVLGVEQTASREEIRSAHRRLAALFHPDRVGDLNAGAAKEAQRLMGEANEAYEVLGNERKRKEYDVTLDDSGRKAEAMANAASAFAQQAARQEAAWANQSTQASPASAPPEEQIVFDVRSYVQLMKSALNDAARTTDRVATMPGLTQMVFDRSLAIAPEVAQEVSSLNVTPSEILYVVGLETLARSCAATFSNHVGPLSADQVYQLEVSRLAHVKMGQVLRPELRDRLNQHPQLAAPEKGKGLKGLIPQVPRNVLGLAILGVMIVVLVVLSYWGLGRLLG